MTQTRTLAPRSSPRGRTDLASEARDPGLLAATGCRTAIFEDTQGSQRSADFNTARLKLASPVSWQRLDGLGRLLDGAARRPQLEAHPRVEQARARAERLPGGWRAGLTALLGLL